MQHIFIQAAMDTLSYVPRILIVMFLSLFISGFLIEMGLFSRLECIGRPLARLAGLPGESAVTFVTSIGSLVAGNTMLVQFYQKRRIGSREVFLSALLNGVPVYLKEIFTYQIPVIIPILGLKVGGIYFLSFLAAGIVRLIFVILYGRLTLDKGGLNSETVNPKAGHDHADRKTHREIIRVVLRRESKVFLKVSSMFICMTFAVFLLINNGALDRLRDFVQPLTDFFKLPLSAAVPVSTYMLSPLVGAASVGAMLKEGVLSDLQAVIACMLGGLLMLPVFSVRYSLAKYTAIFGFSMGTNIVFVSTLLGMLVRVVFLSVFLFMI